MINNKFSNEKCICCAESQWSILGPLLLRTLSNHTAILPKLRGPEIFILFEQFMLALYVGSIMEGVRLPSPEYRIAI